MRALITGITGQDGSYLAEFLLSKGYEVVGVTSGRSARTHIAHIEESMQLVVGDITDRAFVESLFKMHAPDEFYNLASVATVERPWENVESTMRITADAPLHILEAIREHAPSTRFFQASSAQMYGDPAGSLQSEATPFHPKNPYGIAKTCAHHLVGAYRRDHNIFATSGILFNHESPRRGERFITRKVTLSLANIAAGKLEYITCGNLDARRDWGYAKEYVEAMWLMLQANVPDDYVIASGESHTVREFITAAAGAAGIALTWEREGIEEVGKDESGTVRVSIDPSLYRNETGHISCGDPTKVRTELGWEAKTTYEELAALMVKEDLRSA